MLDTTPRRPQSLNHPEYLQVRDESQTDSKLLWGADQTWCESKSLAKRACSLVTATHLTAYLARKLGQVSLFRPYRFASRAHGYIEASHVYTRSEMVEQLHDLSQVLKPGLLGLFRPSRYEAGLNSFFASRGMDYACESLSLSLFHRRSQDLFEDALDFIQEHLLLDVPVSFLLYDRGGSEQVESWHWVTVVGYRYDSDLNQHTLVLLDHNHWVEFDFGAWFKRSLLGGALVSCRHQKGEFARPVVEV